MAISKSGLRLTGLRLTEKLIAQAARPNLTEACEKESFFLYILYRLRAVLLVRSASLVINAIEVIFFLQILERTLFFSFIIVRLFSRLLPSIVWGFHEPFRENLRSLWREKKKSQFAVRVRQGAMWTAVAIASTATLLAAALIYRLTTQREALSVRECLIIAGVLTFMMRLGQSYLFSVVYSVRRVPRPVWLTVVLQVVDLALLVGLWIWLGAYSLPVHLLAVSAIAMSSVVYFAWQVQKSLRLPVWRGRLQQRFGWRKLKTRLIKQLITKWDSRFVARSLYCAVVNTLTVVEFYCVFAISQMQHRMDYASLHLLLPILGFAGSWSSPFFFDLVSEKIPPALRNLFRKSLFAVSVAVGIVSALICLVWMKTIYLFIDTTSQMVMAISLLSVLLSVVSVAHIVAFAHKKYHVCFALAGFLLLVCTAALHLQPQYSVFLSIIGLAFIFFYLTAAEKNHGHCSIIQKNFAGSRVSRAWPEQVLREVLGQRLLRVQQHSEALQIYTVSPLSSAECERLTLQSHGALFVIPSPQCKRAS